MDYGSRVLEFTQRGRHDYKKPEKDHLSIIHRSRASKQKAG